MREGERTAERASAGGLSLRPFSGSNVFIEQCDVGRGVFAERGFARGERILVFRGISVSRSDPMHATEAGANLLQTSQRRYILPEPPGLFVNHSCNPNAGIIGRRRLIAIRDIAAGEEIRFDYSTTMDEDLWTMECKCGEAACRHVVRRKPAGLRQR